jgi:ADP-ribose pyrophosphatase YjhB (NUDIX family)
VAGGPAGAAWLSSWPGRWALGAGGAVDVGETPGDTLTRELREEWGRRGRARARGGARAPAPPARDVHRQAWLPDGAEVTPDHEHDAHAWWPADPADWPAEADEPLRRMAAMLLAAG